MSRSPLAFMDALGNIARGLTDGSRRLVVSIDAVTVAGGVPVVVTPNPLPVVSGATGDKLLGYSSGLSIVNVNSTHAAGAVTVTSTAVPAGEVWNIDSVQAQNFTSAVAGTTMRYTLNSTNVTDLIVTNLVALTQWVWSNSGGTILLSPGESISAIFSNSNLNDNCQLRLHGYKGHTT